MRSGGGGGGGGGGESAHYDPGTVGNNWHITLLWAR